MSDKVRASLVQQKAAYPVSGRPYTYTCGFVESAVYQVVSVPRDGTSRQKTLATARREISVRSKFFF